jgi:hypothetical protein
MQTVTLAQMRARVRIWTGTEGHDTPTDAQIDAALNNSIRRLHAKLAKLAEDDFTESAIIPTVANQRTVELPDPFLVLRAVEWIPGATPVLSPPPLLTEDGVYILSEDGVPLLTETGGEYVLSGPDEPEPLHRFMLQERHRYLGSNGWDCGRPIAYRLVGRSTSHVERMELVPTPTRVHALRVWYVPVAATLSADGDTYDGRSGFEEWVVLDASIGFLVADESDATAAVQERELVWGDQILPIFKARDQAEPDRVIDVTGGDCDY